MLPYADATALLIPIPAMPSVMALPGGHRARAPLPRDAAHHSRLPKPTTGFNSPTLLPEAPEQRHSLPHGILATTQLPQITARITFIQRQEFILYA